MARVTSSPLTASYERTQNMCRSVVMKSMFLDSKDGLKSSKVAMRPRMGSSRSLELVCSFGPLVKIVVNCVLSFGPSVHSVVHFFRVFARRLLPKSRRSTEAYTHTRWVLCTVRRLVEKKLETGRVKAAHN